MSISYKLMLAVGCVGIITISIFSYYNLSSHRERLTAQIENSARQISETVKSSTKYAMLINQRESVHQIIDTIGRQEGIVKVRVFNKEGRIIFSSYKKEIGGMVDKTAEACYVCHAAGKPIEKLSLSSQTRIYRSKTGTRHLGIINPIYNEPACWQARCHAHRSDQKVLGVYDSVLSLRKVDEGNRRNLAEMLFFALSAIIANSLIIWFLVSRLIGRPVRRLVLATKAVSSGDFNYKIDMNKKGELGYLAGSFDTMTQKLLETQKMLYHSDKLASLGRLAAGVAHEINNPLTGVLTYSSFHLKRAPEKSELRNDLEVIVRETNRCREIVRGLLDFARQAPPKKTETQINEIITQALGIVENQMTLNHIYVKQRLQNNMPCVKVDKGQMLQVIINLLVNAVDAIGTGGGDIEITTGLKRADDTDVIEIIISDTGCGIDAAVLPRIFEPFFTTKGQKGTGLGLAMVWGIIDEHGGHITADSTAGRGTTFTIALKL